MNTEKNTNYINKVTDFLALFASFSTIFCCVLPSIFVLLGAGSAFAGLTANIPQLTWVAEHKVWFMIFAATMLSINTYQLYIKPASCPTDKNLATACQKTKKASKAIYWAALILLVTSTTFSYILPLFMR